MTIGLALETKPYAERIFDLGVHIPQDEMEGYIADLRATLARPHLSGQYRSYLFNTLANALQRLGFRQEALDAFGQAHRAFPTATSLGNLGTAHMEAGDLDAALDHLARAADMPNGRTVGILGNLSATFWQSGAPEQALATLQEAVGVADMNSVKETYALSLYAAEQHLYTESVEFLARSLALRHGLELGDAPAIAVVLQASGSGTAVTPAMYKAVQYVASFEGALHAPEGEAEGEHGAILAEFEVTRPMREEASKAILQQGSSLRCLIAGIRRRWNAPGGRGSCLPRRWPRSRQGRCSRPRMPPSLCPIPARIVGPSTRLVGSSLCRLRPTIRPLTPWSWLYLARPPEGLTWAAFPCLTRSCPATRAPSIESVSSRILAWCSRC